MDYFNGITNKEFTDYFAEDLLCRTVLQQYIYPHENASAPDIIDQHIERCLQILHCYLFTVLSASGHCMEGEMALEIQMIYNSKKAELRPLLSGVINDYLQIVKVQVIKFDM